MKKMNREYDGKFKATIKNELGEAISVTQVNVRRGKHIQIKSELGKRIT